MLNTQIDDHDTEATAVERFAWWHTRHSGEVPSTAAARYRELLPTSMPNSGEQFAFEVDLDCCSGCKACVTACHQLNGLDTNETWRKVGWLTGSAELPIVQHVTTACHHCVEPACLSGCPTQAYEKDALTGIVTHLDDQCFGCKYCIMMCPYEVPQYNASLGIVRKCDMCSQRLSEGEAPACVQACPHAAIRITIVDQSKVRLHSHGSAALVSGAPLSTLTQPTTQYLGRCQTGDQRLHTEEDRQLSPEHGHWPLVVMLVLTQASVGLWTFNTCLRLISSSTTTASAISQFIALVLGVIGVHVALLHLGRPWLAMRGWLGWRTSWLSREVIAFSIYLGTASAAVGASYFELRLTGIVLDVLTALTGTVALGCSAMVYIATRRPLWSGTRMALEFAGTSLSLGASGCLAIAELVAQANASDQLVVTLRLYLVALAIGGAALARGPKWLDWRRSESQSLSVSAIDASKVYQHSSRSGRLLTAHFGRSWRSGWALLMSAGLGGLLVIALPNERIWTSVMMATTLLAHALIVRWHSFGTIVFKRMPGAAQ